MERMKRVLIVDDQFLISEYLRICVETFGYEVCGTAKSADEAVARALELKPDCILMDFRLGGDKDGVDAAIEISRECDSRVIYVTGSNENSTHDKISTDHPFRTLIKPVNLDELREALEAA